ncbi:MAG: hypothetical protein KF900_07495 [Bacteroidetes bacterium]|nr:hypothetical protein [Bacteroidota bacterium]
MKKIIRTKSFVKQLENWQEYKLENEEDLRHYIQKLRHITELIIEISELESYLGKKVNYRTSKKIQYFIYQQHVVFFRLEPHQLTLLYFVAAKRIKRKLES